MLEQQPQHVRRFFWLISAGALILLIAVLTVAGKPPEWTPDSPETSHMRREPGERRWPAC